MDWTWVGKCDVQQGDEDWKVDAEGIASYQNVPSTVVGLTEGEPVMLLDTELGVVYWVGCLGELQEDTAREQILDDPEDYAAEGEVDWRSDGACWSIPDFFEALKDHYRQLHFVPINSHKVEDVYPCKDDERSAMLAMGQSIYRLHGWPNLEQYNKEECHRDIQRALREEFPDYAD